MKGPFPIAGCLNECLFSNASRDDAIIRDSFLGEHRVFVWVKMEGAVRSRRVYVLDLPKGVGQDGTLSMFNDESVALKWAGERLGKRK